VISRFSEWFLPWAARVGPYIFLGSLVGFTIYAVMDVFWFFVRGTWRPLLLLMVVLFAPAALVLTLGRALLQRVGRLVNSS